MRSSGVARAWGRPLITTITILMIIIKRTATTPGLHWFDNAETLELKKQRIPDNTD
jgi:hypothetical protein